MSYYLRIFNARQKTPAPPLYACLFTLILDIDTIVSLAPASLSLGLGFMWHQMANPDRCHNTCVIRPCKPCSVAGAQYWDPTHTSRKVLYNACSVAVLSARMLMLCSSAQWWAAPRMRWTPGCGTAASVSACGAPTGKRR